MYSVFLIGGSYKMKKQWSAHEVVNLTISATEYTAFRGIPCCLTKPCGNSSSDDDSISSSNNYMGGSTDVVNPFDPTHFMS